MAWDLKGATTEERFFAPRPGAQKPCGGKSRAASLRMTMCGGGFMSDLKVRPPEARNARLRLARRAQARPLLFLLCCLSLFGRWGNDVLEPHVGDEIAVVFHVVRVVNVEHAEFGHVHAEHLDGLCAGRIGHTVISLVTVGERTFERGDEIGF